jgi:hypothetical protein
LATARSRSRFARCSWKMFQLFFPNCNADSRK